MFYEFINNDQISIKYNYAKKSTRYIEIHVHLTDTSFCLLYKKQMF